MSKTYPKTVRRGWEHNFRDNFCLFGRCFVWWSCPTLARYKPSQGSYGMFVECFQMRMKQTKITWKPNNTQSMSMEPHLENALERCSCKVQTEIYASVRILHRRTSIKCSDLHIAIAHAIIFWWQHLDAHQLSTSVPHGWRPPSVYPTATNCGHGCQITCQRPHDGVVVHDPILWEAISTSTSTKTHRNLDTQINFPSLQRSMRFFPSTITGTLQLQKNPNHHLCKGHVLRKPIQRKTKDPNKEGNTDAFWIR